MEPKNHILQKLHYEDDKVGKALRYYRFLLAVNGLSLPNKELELLAFTAVRGTITPLPARKDFIVRFGSSLNSIENLKGSLHKKGLLVITDGKYRVHPSLQIDFDKEIYVKMHFKTKHEEKDNTEG